MLVANTIKLVNYSVGGKLKSRAKVGFGTNKMTVQNINPMSL